jgi:hypothetical protein
MGWLCELRPASALWRAPMDALKAERLNTISSLAFIAIGGGGILAALDGEGVVFGLVDGAVIFLGAWICASLAARKNLRRSGNDLLKWALVFFIISNRRRGVRLWRNRGCQCGCGAHTLYIFVVIFLVLLVMALMSARRTREVARKVRHRPRGGPHFK